MSTSAKSDAAASAEGPFLWHEAQTLPAACRGLLIEVIDVLLLRGKKKRQPRALGSNSPLAFLCL